MDENSRILVVVFVSKLNFSISFRFLDENYRIFVVVIIFMTKINLLSTKIFVSVVVDEKNTGMHWRTGNCMLAITALYCLSIHPSVCHTHAVSGMSKRLSEQIWYLEWRQHRSLLQCVIRWSSLSPIIIPRSFVKSLCKS